MMVDCHPSMVGCDDSKIFICWRGHKDQLPNSHLRILYFYLGPDTSRSTYVMPRVPKSANQVRHLVTYFSKPSCDWKYLTFGQTSTFGDLDLDNMRYDN